MRKLMHPRIVPVYAFRAGARGNAVTLRYMPGGDAGGMRGAPVAEVVALGRDVADALAYLHDVGVVHRDVKLSNVLLDAAGRAHLADFGIAWLARGDEDGMVLKGGGSRASMSPEQRAGGLPSRRTTSTRSACCSTSSWPGSLPSGDAAAAAPRVRLPAAVPDGCAGSSRALLAASARRRPPLGDRGARRARGDRGRARAAVQSRAAGRPCGCSRRLGSSDRVVRPSSDSARPRSRLEGPQARGAPLALGRGSLPARGARCGAVAAALGGRTGAAGRLLRRRRHRRRPPRRRLPRRRSDHARGPAAESRDRAARPTAGLDRKAAAPRAAGGSNPRAAGRPGAGPTPDRQAEAAALARHRDAGQARSSARSGGARSPSTRPRSRWTRT